MVLALRRLRQEDELLEPSLSITDPVSKKKKKKDSKHLIQNIM
jgi:hypothetical protein